MFLKESEILKFAMKDVRTPDGYFDTQPNKLVEPSLTNVPAEDEVSFLRFFMYFCYL